MIPKPPFKIYRVYDWFDGLEIQHVTVSKITPKKWKLVGRSGLAFGCRSQLDPIEDPALTPIQAAEQYLSLKDVYLNDARVEYSKAATFLSELRLKEEIGLAGGVLNNGKSSNDLDITVWEKLFVDLKKGVQYAPSSEAREI